jgi:hypothetical protein
MGARQIITAEGWRALYMRGPSAAECELIPLVAWALGDDDEVTGLVLGVDGLVGPPDAALLATYLPPAEPLPERYRLDELWNALVTRGGLASAT